MSEQSGGAEGAQEPDRRPHASGSWTGPPEQESAQDWSRPGGPGYPPPQAPTPPPAGWPQYQGQPPQWSSSPYPPGYPPQGHGPQSHPVHGYPQPPYPPPYGYGGVPAPQHRGVRSPAPAGGPPRIQPVAGTEFGLAYFNVPPVVSGQAIGSMVAGILSILVSFVVGCFGLAGAQPGWGPIVSGAFAVLATAAGLAAIGLGWFSVRQITRSGRSLAGRGMAIAGISCGGAGLTLTVVAMLLALLI